MKKLSCEKIRVASAAIVDGEAALISSDEIDAHVSQCAACRDAIASLTDLPSSFDGVARVEDEHDVWSSIHDQLDSRPTRSARKWKSPFATGVAVIVLILMIVALIPLLGDSPLRDSAGDANESTEADSPASPNRQDNSHLTTAQSDVPDSSYEPPDQPAMVVSVAAGMFDESSGGGGAPAPYSDESGADEFAIGVVKKVVEREGSEFLPLRLNEVFIGRLPSGRFLAEDKMVVQMECSLPPRELGLRSQLYAPGTSVVVYLSRGETDGWVVNSIVPISAGQEDYWRDRLQMFAEIVLARESEKPEERFRELLIMRPDGSLPNYYAIAIFPHPAARPVVRDLWRERVKQHPVDPQENEMVGAVSLIYLMRNLNEGEMLGEILEHALRQEPGRRGFYFGELRILADYADSDARMSLVEDLRKFIDDSPALESLDPAKNPELWRDLSIAKQTLEDLVARQPQRQNPN